MAALTPDEMARLRNFAAGVPEGGASPLAEPIMPGPSPLAPITPADTASGDLGPRLPEVSDPNGLGTANWAARFRAPVADSIAATPPEVAPVPALSAMEMLAQRGRGGGRGGGGGGGGARTREAQGSYDAAQAARQALLRAQAEEARTRGGLEAEAIEGTIQRSAELRAEQLGEEEAAREKYDGDRARLTEAMAARHDLASSDGRSKLLGGNIVSALAIGLGAFASAAGGGPNAALQVIDRRMRDEVETKKRLIQAAGMKVGDAKDLVSMSFREIGDLKASGHAAMAEMYGIAELQAKRAAAVAGGEEAAQRAEGMAAELRVRQEAENLKAAQAAQRASRGPSAMQRLKLQAQQLENEKNARALAGGGEAGQKITAATVTALNKLDSGDEAANRAVAAIDAAIAQGYTHMEGGEGHRLDTLGERLTQTGAKFVPIEGRGVTGVSPELSQATGLVSIVALADFTAKTHQAADREREWNLALKAASGDGTLAYARKNIMQGFDEREKVRNTIVSSQQGQGGVAAFKARRGKRTPEETIALQYLNAASSDPASQVEPKASGAPTAGAIPHGE